MALWIIYGSFDGSKFIKLTHRPVEASAIDDFLNYYSGWLYFAWPADMPMSEQLLDAIAPAELSNRDDMEVVCHV